MDVLIFWTGPVCFEVFPGSDESLCVCVWSAQGSCLCVGGLLPLCDQVQMRAVVPYARHQRAEELFADARGGWRDVWITTTGGCESDTTPRQLMLLLVWSLEPAPAVPAAAPAPHRPSSSSWKRFLWAYVDRNKPRLGLPRLCCSSHLRGCVRSVRFLCFK